MALPGKNATIWASSDDSVYYEIDGIKSVDFGRNADLLDTTDFKDTTGFKTRIQGLRDGTFDLSGDYESADTAQTTIQTVFNSGASIYIKYLPDGTNGWKAECKVESIDVSATVDGLIETSITCQFTGAVSTV
jgi:predicted secreted protein